MESIIKILLAGDKKLCPFYYSFFYENRHETYLMHDFQAEKRDDTAPQKDGKNESEIRIATNKDKFDIILIFIRAEIHSAEDELKEINNIYGSGVPVMAVCEKDRFVIIDLLYNLNVIEIIFEFVPEKILNAINIFNEKLNDRTNIPNKKNPKNYIIDFYENKDILVIDISGFILREKLGGLKLMFMNYLKDKIKRLRGIVYIFSDINESLLNFQNVWSLLRIWNELGISYSKVTYLTNSKILIELIEKYFLRFGLQLYPNLLEIVRFFYPELAEKNEMELFDFSSQILLTQHRVVPSK
ncbi:MAG: hypothetical protein JXB50_01380 [Spirochaetes bacterium]|nr:hypothetical protein [Spirochaetota bacterium]